MQSRSPLFEEIAKSMETALSLAQAAGEEARAVLRAQGDRVAAEFDLVRRDEFEAMRETLQAQIQTLQSELARLNVSQEKSRAPDVGG
jgi:BMFP domain-containing protein YqiC